MTSETPSPEDVLKTVQRAQAAADKVVNQVAKRSAILTSPCLIEAIIRAESFTSQAQAFHRQFASIQVEASRHLLNEMNQSLYIAAANSTRWLEGLNQQLEIFQVNWVPLLAGIEKQLSASLPAFETWRRHYAEGIAILISKGWWPHPDWPVSLFSEVVALKRKGKLRQLDKLICDAYAANRFQPMSSSVKEWLPMPEFHEHRRQINAGFKAYKRDDYVSAVYDWLPSIEPIWLSLASELGLNNVDKDKFADAYHDARNGQPEIGDN